MLKLTELRKTTRKAGAEGRRVVYPHFLRDRTLAPRIEMAVRYLESMLGRPRRDLDPEAVVQLFGDHKVARGVVHALAPTYRHRPRAFADVLPPDRAAALAARGVAGPSDLRLWLYARANAELSGFVGGAERAPFLRAAGAELGLGPEQVEELLALDAPANAILERTGPVPAPDDVIARFNFATVGALLANSSLVRFTLRRAPADPDALRALCAAAGVRADLGAHALLVHGRQDALEGWARHGARVVRLCATLLACGLPASGGEATVAVPGGGEWLLRLDGEVLGYLGAAPGGAPARRDAMRAAFEAWRRADALAAEFAALRRAGRDGGWTLRRAAEPLVAAGALVPALFTCSRGARRVALVPEGGVADAALAAVAARVPLVVLDLLAGREAPPPPRAVDGTPRLRHAGRGDLDPLPELLERAAEASERHAATARLDTALAEASVAGVLAESRLAALLGCRDEEVAARFERPEVRAAQAARGLRYVEGFGLCSADLLARARAAADDVAAQRAGQPVGPAWTVRVLGRRLREVTGTSEGIECLIAYLGAA